MADKSKPTGKKSSRSQKDRTSAEALEDARRQILAEMVSRAGDAGWGAAGLRATVKSLGIDERQGRLAFPRGISDVLLYFCRDGDRRMEEALEATDLSAMRVPDKITLAVKTRLSVVEDHKEAVKRATTLLSLPLNAPLAMQALYGTVDAIWRGIGDTSEGTTFYTKRLTLSGVYSSTLLVWLGDESEDHEAAWRFLDGRLADVATFGKVTSSLGDVAARLPGLLDQWRSGNKS